MSSTVLALRIRGSRNHHLIIGSSLLYDAPVRVPEGRSEKTDRKIDRGPCIFAAHLTTQYVDYLPTRDAYSRGGHEANEDVTYWAKLAPGSL